MLTMIVNVTVKVNNRLKPMVVMAPVFTGMGFDKTRLCIWTASMA